MRDEGVEDPGYSTPGRGKGVGLVCGRVTDEASSCLHCLADCSNGVLSSVRRYVLLTARQPFTSPKTQDPMEVGGACWPRGGPCLLQGEVNKGWGHSAGAQRNLTLMNDGTHVRRSCAASATSAGPSATRLT